MDFFEEDVRWRRALIGGGYVTSHKGRQLRLRMNDFPDEQLYTLFADGKSVAEFDDWPSRWLR